MDVANMSNLGEGYLDGLTISHTRFVGLNSFGGAFLGTDGDLLHANYLFIRTAGNNGRMTNITVSACFFGETNASPAGSGGTGAIFISQGPSVNIYNCVFDNSWSITGVIPIAYQSACGPQCIRIYNNSFYRHCGSSPICITPTDSNRSVYVENNLFINYPGMNANAIMLNDDPGADPKVLDYDFYYSPDVSASSFNVGVWYNFAHLQGAMGFEAHGQWANPLYNNPAPPTLDCSIATNSPAIGAGANLSAYFSTDYAGNARPASGAWTIGAYQSGAAQQAAGLSVTPGSQNFGAVAVGATSNLSFTVQNTGGSTLTGSVSVSSPFSIVSGGSYSLGAGQSQTVTVSYSPTAAGTNSQTVTFTGAGNGSGAVSGAVSGAAYVPSGVILVTPASQSFGAVAVGATANTTFTVQNIASGTLMGTASVAAPFSIISGGSYSLGAGQSQTVTVSYSPTTAGTNSQTVTFTGAPGGGSGAVSGTAVAPPVVSAITQNGADVDINASGLQIYAGSVVQYSGSASDPNGLPLTWQWGYTLNGGPQTVVQSGTGPVASVSFNYTASTAGNTYLWTLLASNGISTAASTLTVGVEAPPPATASLTFQASNAVVTAPFVLTSGYISQSVQTTDPTTGGQAVFTFTITNTGDYIIQALVNAPNSANNSLFVNVDAQPSSPTMIWDIPVTSGFEQRIVSWRGNGTDVNNQFVPAVYNLSAGVHQFIIRGREANTQLQSLAILWWLPAPILNSVSPSP
jgi:hypothetical protein